MGAVATGWLDGCCNPLGRPAAALRRVRCRHHPSRHRPGFPRHGSGQADGRGEMRQRHARPTPFLRSRRPICRSVCRAMCRAAGKIGDGRLDVSLGHAEALAEDIPPSLEFARTLFTGPATLGAMVNGTPAALSIMGRCRFVRHATAGERHVGSGGTTLEGAGGAAPPRRAAAARGLGAERYDGLAGQWLAVGAGGAGCGTRSCGVVGDGDVGGLAAHDGRRGRCRTGDGAPECHGEAGCGHAAAACDKPRNRRRPGRWTCCMQPTRR